MTRAEGLPYVTRDSILVVDDDESIRQIVRIYLSEEGYVVREASNGQIALEMLADFQPAVILLDLRMPVMDGWEFTRRYRETAGPHAPVIAFVAAVNGPDPAHPEHDQYLDWLGGSFDPEELDLDIVNARLGALAHVGSQRHR